MQTEYFIYVRSDQSLEYWKDNKPYAFRIHLNKPLYLAGIWKVALLDCHVVTKNPPSSVNESTRLYFMCDICEDSIVEGCNLSLLHRVFRSR